MVVDGGFWVLAPAEATFSHTLCLYGLDTSKGHCRTACITGVCDNNGRLFVVVDVAIRCVTQQFDTVDGQHSCFLRQSCC